MHLVDRILTIVDRCLQWLIRPRPRQICWTSSPDYGENAFYLYRHMLETREGFDHCWLIGDRAAGERAMRDYQEWSGRIRPNHVQVVRRHSLRGYWVFLRSRYTFHTHGVYRWVRSAHGRDVVSLWHGMPIKAIEALDSTSRADIAFGTVHLACSDPYRDIIAAAFLTRVDDVLLAALPRSDVLNKPSALAPGKDRVRDALGVAGDRRLVLWMPTYRTPSNFRVHPPGELGFASFVDDIAPELWSALDAQAQRHHCHVVIKLHQFDALATIDFDPRRRWNLNNVTLVRGTEWDELGVPLYDVLAVADGLVSDVSSVMIDWLTTQRPLGMVGGDPETFVRDLLVDVTAIAASPRVHDLTDGGELEDFFVRVGEGRDAPPDPDLDALLHRADLRDGCDAILDAVGLSRSGGLR